jgi:acid stress-induced BolA-like protein IbaG/YrbA
MGGVVETALAERVREAILRVVPGAQIDTEMDYFDRVSVVVVSNDFDDMPQEERQENLWEALKAALGDEALGVGIVLAYSWKELH